MSEPPGNENHDWLLWEHWPPGYKLHDQVLELWRPEWDNGTTFVQLGNVQAALNVAGLWWRRA